MQTCVLKYLKLPLRKKWDPEARMMVALDDKRREVFSACYRLLRDFCETPLTLALRDKDDNNMRNQLELFPHVPLFLEHAGALGNPPVSPCCSQ